MVLEHFGFPKPEGEICKNTVESICWPLPIPSKDSRVKSPGPVAWA